MQSNPHNERYLTKDFTVNFKDHGEVTVPKGTKTNSLVAGDKKNSRVVDTHYNYVCDFSWVQPHNFDGKLIPQHGLIHDLTYYGLNIPNEYLSDSVH